MTSSQLRDRPTPMKFVDLYEEAIEPIRDWLEEFSSCPDIMPRLERRGEYLTLGYAADGLMPGAIKIDAFNYLSEDEVRQRLRETVIRALRSTRNQVIEMLDHMEGTS